MYKSNFLIVFLFGILLTACQSKPKVIESEPISTANSEGSAIINFPPLQEEAEIHSDVHQVVVQEVLNTEKYSYLNVTENEANFWVAIPRMEVEIGDTYFYKGGLLKKNFQSQEFNRVFETVYLVSDIRKQPRSSGSAIDEALSHTLGGTSVVEDVTPAQGAIKIEELVSNLNKYEGKLVTITGKCVKVNPMIMGKNWVHLQDGSANNYDLTITTAEVIPVGVLISLEGTISLNKDFGAGYRYDVIMEDAVIK